MPRLVTRGVPLAATVVLTVVISVPVSVWASHRFSDVPDSHTFHNAIDWLADNGITVGCNPPANDRYCPDDFVTRGEMAAFMKRLAERQVVDADAVDGFDAALLAPRAAYDRVADVPPGPTATLSVDVDAPAPGVLLISGGVDAQGFVTLDDYGCNLEVDNVLLPGTAMESRVDGNTTINTNENCVAIGAIAVAAGGHSVDLEIVGVGPDTNLGGATVWAVWIPFEGSGVVPSP
jgi:hypothetical protein